MVHVGKIYHTWILWVRTMVGPTNYLVQVIATSHEFSPQIGGLVREMGPLISGTPRLVNKKLTSPVMPLKVESVLYSLFGSCYFATFHWLSQFFRVNGHQSTNQETVTNDVFWAIGAFAPPHMAIPTWSQSILKTLTLLFFEDHPTTKKP